MDNKEELLNVPYIVYEGTQARNERTVRRLIMVIILLVTMLFAANAIWLYAWTSYDYVEEGYENIDLDAGSGNANYIGRDLINGEINNGENQGDPLQTENED